MASTFKKVLDHHRRKIDQTPLVETEVDPKPNKNTKRLARKVSNNNKPVPRKAQSILRKNKYSQGTHKVFPSVLRVRHFVNILF